MTWHCKHRFMIGCLSKAVLLEAFVCVCEQSKCVLLSLHCVIPERETAPFTLHLAALTLPLAAAASAACRLAATASAVIALSSSSSSFCVSA